MVGLRAILRQNVLQKHFVGPLRQHVFIAKNVVVDQGPIGGVVGEGKFKGADLAGVQDEIQPVLARLVPFLGPFPFRDVDQNADRYFLLVDIHRHAFVVLHPDITSILVADAVFDGTTGHFAAFSAEGEHAIAICRDADPRPTNRSGWPRPR